MNILKIENEQGIVFINLQNVTTIIGAKGDPDTAIHFTGDDEAEVNVSIEAIHAALQTLNGVNLLIVDVKTTEQ
jgi:hypothetical protein